MASKSWRSHASAKLWAASDSALEAPTAIPTANAPTERTTSGTARLMSLRCRESGRNAASQDCLRRAERPSGSVARPASAGVGGRSLIAVENSDRKRLVSLIDIGIAVFALAMAAVGWERGLVRSALPLAGFVGGVFAGARLAPLLLEGGAESPYAPAVAAGGGILLGVFLAIALEGAGQRLSVRLAERPATRRIDSAGGAVLFLGLALAAAWVFGAVALNLPGQNAREIREAVQRSSILVALNDVAPPSGAFLNALRRIDPTRSVKGPEADVGPPDSALARDPEVVAASRSVVRVTGSACGLGIEGSGWIAGPGIVVTNAHVVAGQDDTQVTTTDGRTLDAGALHYEPQERPRSARRARPRGHASRPGRDSRARAPRRSLSAIPRAGRSRSRPRAWGGRAPSRARIPMAAARSSAG